MLLFKLLECNVNTTQKNYSSKTSAAKLMLTAEF